MRKGLILLFLLLIISIGVLGVLQSPPDHDVKIEQQSITINQQL